MGKQSLGHTADWAQPHVISDVQAAFPASVSHLMPSRAECEEALRAMKGQGREWRAFQTDWFFSGLKDVKVKVRRGVDAEAAWRHLSAIQGSFEPKHEHKAAAVAYLASLWFAAPPEYTKS